MPALDPDLRIRVYKNTPVIFNMYRPRPDECQKRLPAHRVRKHPGGGQKKDDFPRRDSAVSCLVKFYDCRTSCMHSHS